ncbi:DUF262 domain-containing protein [Xanthomonas citri pv. citri]|nr:DUF262 domain-containing protein [Xanthomonas citri pv. citri]MBD4628675.1 DUF262 domain-containing protein [Xanthomonas citri pv. citri]MBD4659971.1 DUF262 domain-containing protein [Xanthomonas citri pv. citri]MBD4664502.1 DUF262 domain-containing protein [Xanthomonas citri pv. citri]
MRPEYQRLFRWTIEQRSRLIESIVLGLPIPPIFLIEGQSGILELIDGLQRTSSVLQFLDHGAINEPELRLAGCDIVNELNSKVFSELPLTVRLKIKRSPIRATIINKSGDAFVKYEMFKRLNTGGSLLSSQEIRNCSSRMVEGGDLFYDAIQEMAKYPSFVRAIQRLLILSERSALMRSWSLGFSPLRYSVTITMETLRSGSIQLWNRYCSERSNSI